jgi:hypothetical protein
MYAAWPFALCTCLMLSEREGAWQHVCSSDFCHRYFWYSHMLAKRRLSNQEFVCRNGRIAVFSHTHIYMCMCVCVRACACMWPCAQVSVSMCVRVCVCMRARARVRVTANARRSANQLE